MIAKKAKRCSARAKYWEIIARNFKKRGWSSGYVSAVDSEGEQSGLLTHIAANA
jgi:hypothetical protein